MNKLENSRKLIMVSLDAVSTKDVEKLMNMPNFSRICKEGTLVTEVDSVFISNTYPAHTSIITGMHPKNHEIFDNLVFKKEKTKQPWRYDAREIKAPTLHEKAKQAGKTVTAILYPVTGKADIDYNMPEIPEEMHILQRVKTMFQYGSPSFLWSIILRHGRYFKGIDQPALDDFTTRIAVDNVIRKKPDLLLLHLIDTDTQKHIYGPDSREAEQSLARHDRRLGELLSAVAKAGQPENTSLLIFSDHGCLSVHTTLDPDSLLAEQGLIQGEEYFAFSHSAGGSVFFKLLDPAHQHSFEKAMKEFSNSPAFGRRLTQKEMHYSGMDTRFSVGFEAAEGYSFGEEHLGQHGYALDHPGYQPFYLATGHGIPENQEKTGGEIIDICPLAAAMLELPPWDMEGVNRINQ